MSLINTHTAYDEDLQIREIPVEQLIAQLHSASLEQRRQAALQLAAHPGQSQPLLSALGRELQRSVREAILSSLIKLADPAVVQALAEFLRSQDISLRNEVFEVLKARSDLSLTVIQTLLQDEDPDVRIYAVNALEALHDPQVEPWLIQVLLEEPHVNVCATALNLLGEIGTAACVPALQQLKQRFADEPYICFAANLTLERVHGA